ncbi:hypothetical protein DTO169C6_3611 [Paecilomyces variotii]|nr:hypothetical protein DTO169C6_3611 [Paecilomyces variotii]
MEGDDFVQDASIAARHKEQLESKNDGILRSHPILKSFHTDENNCTTLHMEKSFAESHTVASPRNAIRQPITYGPMLRLMMVSR